MAPRGPFLAVLLLAACAAAPDPATAPDGTGHVIVSGDALHVAAPGARRTVSAEIAAPVAEVWAALPAVLQEMGLAGTADAATRTVATPPRMMSRRVADQPLTRIVDCGQGQYGAELAAVNPVRLALRVTVQPGTGDGARLDTVLEAQVRNVGGANAVMAVCRSLGSLEAEIASRLRARLAA